MNSFVSTAWWWRNSRHIWGVSENDSYLKEY